MNGTPDEVDLDPAVRLLLLLAARRPTADADERARELVDAGVDWDHFIAQARRHRVAGLVAVNLRRFGLLGRDQYLYAAADLFQALYLYHRARNEALQREAEVILDRLAGEGLRVVVRKGLHLARNVYRDPGVRPMADMDFLMVRSDTKAAVEVLGELGYQMGDTTRDRRRVLPLPREQAAFWRMHVNNLPPLFRLTSEPTVEEFIVDISVGLFLPASGFRVPTEEILARAVPAPFGVVDALVPAPVDLVLDLCAHLYKESTTLRYLHRLKHQRLIQYCDLREVLAQHAGALFWESLTARSAGYGIEGPVYFALAHLDRLFPGTVPPTALDALGREVPEHFLDHYGSVDFGLPRRWDRDFPTRMFARETEVDLPESGSPV